MRKVTFNPVKTTEPVAQQKPAEQTLQMPMMGGMPMMGAMQMQQKSAEEWSKMTPEQQNAYNQQLIMW